MSLLPFGFIFKLCLNWCQNESYFFLPVVISHHFCLVNLKQQIKVIGRPPRNNTSVSVFNVTIFGLVKLEKTLGFKVWDALFWMFTEPFPPTNYDVPSLLWCQGTAAFKHCISFYSVVSTWWIIFLTVGVFAYRNSINHLCWSILFSFPLI